MSTKHKIQSRKNVLYTLLWVSNINDVIKVITQNLRLKHELKYYSNNFHNKIKEKPGKKWNWLCRFFRTNFPVLVARRSLQSGLMTQQFIRHP